MDKNKEAQGEAITQESTPGNEDSNVHNYALKVYMSEQHKSIPKFTYVDVDLSQPGSVPLSTETKAKKKGNADENEEKYSIEIMRELYPYYVKSRNELSLTKLLWLDPVLGSFHKPSANRKMFGGGMNFEKPAFDRSFWEGDNPQLKTDDVRAFVRDTNKFTMKDFVNEVREGTFSCDEIEPFVAHVERATGFEISKCYKSYEKAKAKGLEVEEEVEEEEDEDDDKKQKAGSGGGGREGGGGKSISKAFHKATKEADPFLLLNAMAHIARTYRKRQEDPITGPIFNVSLVKEAKEKMNFKDIEEQKIWNTAFSMMHLEIPRPKAGITEDLPSAIDFSKSSKNVSSPSAASVKSIRQSPSPKQKKGRAASSPGQKRSARKNKHQESMSEIMPCNSPNCFIGDEMDADLLCQKCNTCYVHQECAVMISLKERGRTTMKMACKDCAGQSTIEILDDDPSAAVAVALQSPAASLSGSRVENLEDENGSIPNAVRCANVRCEADDPDSLVEKSALTRCIVCKDSYCHPECLVEMKCSTCLNKSESAKMDGSLKKKKQGEMERTVPIRLEFPYEEQKVPANEEDEKQKDETKEQVNDDDSSSRDSSSTATDNNSATDEENSKVEVPPRKKRKTNPAPKKKTPPPKRATRSRRK